MATALAAAPLVGPSDRIRRSFDPVVVARGELYALRGVVTVLEGDAHRVSAIVRGTLPYDVTIRFEHRERGGVLAASCTCAHAARNMCKHVWAALRIAERVGHLSEAGSGSGDLQILAAAPAASDPQRRSEIRWVIDLPASHPYAELPIDVFERSTLPLGFSTGFRAVPLAHRTFERALPGRTYEEVLALARTRRCDVIVARDRPPEPLVVDEGGPFRVVILVDEVPGPATPMPALVVRAELRRGDETIAIDALTAVYHSGFAFLGPRMLAIACDAPFRWVTALHKRNEMLVPPEESLRFVRELVTKCRRTTFALPSAIALEERTSFCTRVHVRRPNGDDAPIPRTLRSLAVDVVFEYGGAKAAWRDGGSLAFEQARRRLVIRDGEAEQAAIAELIAAGFDRARRRDDVRGLKIPPSRLTDAILALPSDRFVVEADGIVHRRATTASLSAETGIDWFDLTAKVAFDDLEVDAPALLEAAKRGEKLVRLGDGTVGILPSDWLARVGGLIDLAEAPEAQADDGDALHLRFRHTQLALVDSMLGDAAGVAWDGPLASLRKQLGGFRELPPAETPPGFRGDLRDYQRAGLAWMQWLAGLGFSGCLADDMGLGKTVQVLALLVARKQQQRDDTTSLVVAPRSVVYNWLDEAKRFAPDLRVRELGSRTTENEVRACDVVVTTYGIVRRRADLQTMPFDYVILDEAHAIKNAGASTSRAARLLRSRHRLALTGTPIENHLGELAALFDFLNPGMLGPSVRAAARRSLDLEPAQGARLGRGLRPFVLRRKKADVLAELPPRVDQTLVCVMEPAQRALYDRVKKHYQGMLLAAAEQNDDGSRFFVFEALLRLRQIACHPGLVDPALQQQRSAKVDAVIEQLEATARAGKKAIVFSQFTRLLDIVGCDLDARQIRYARLDGKTSNRKEVVQRFQHEASCQVFLVSLKAGGVGLNLTAAEYVFLLDPWWNPAAEAQAVDRAHRIGQTKTVHAYRLLCKDTIEERVAELQEKKRKLVTSVFEGTETARLGTLSVEDVEALLS